MTQPPNPSRPAMTEAEREAMVRLADACEKATGPQAVPVASGFDPSRDYPDNTYTPYGRRSVHNLAKLLGIVCQRPTVVSVINRAYDEIVFRKAILEEQPSDNVLDAIADAIDRAQCPGREGPYGGYDYGYNEDFYGPAPEKGRYVVRDFRDPWSPDWGKPVHYAHDREVHEDAFRTFTRRHIALAAWTAARANQGTPA